VNAFIFVVVSLLVPEKRELREQRESMRMLASPNTDAEASAVHRQP
jgi:hypothetical protein